MADPQNGPTPEARAAAWDAHRDSQYGGYESLQAAVDAVWSVARVKFEADDDYLGGVIDGMEKNNAALAARLAAAEKVVEAAKVWRNLWPERGYELPHRVVDALVAAVDAYRTHEPEETHHG